MFSRPTTIALYVNGAISIFTVALGLAKTGNPSRYFGEGRFTTGVSCAQLLMVAFFCARIFFARIKIAPHHGLVSASWLWALIAAGFVFLAADDAFQIHEQLDKMLHRFLSLRQTTLTDRIDDAIIAVYGALGAGVLWIFRKEVFRFRQMMQPLLGGFACLLVSVFFDAIANDDKWLLWITGDLAVAKRLNGWCSVGDGAFTLLAEGLFVAAFYLVFRAASKVGAVEASS